MKLPFEYVIAKFYEYVGNPKHNSFTDTYYGSCPICREGASWLKKRRCFFIPQKDLIYCHNCGWSSRPLKWIQEVTHMSYDEIIDECEQDLIIPTIKQTKLQISPTLPDNSINLYDTVQTSFYQDNEIVQLALKEVKRRRLDTAINRPKAIYLSLTDFTHKNRLILPFYDDKIVFYQSRELFPSQAKYLSRRNSEKTLFNFDNIDSSLEYVFIFEGPIDSFFVRNGIAVAGIQEKSHTLFTTAQQQQIQQLIGVKQIWVLDSQWLDRAAFKKTQILLDQGKSVFIWPKDFGEKFKDFNDIAIALGLNEIPLDFILKNTCSGYQGSMKLTPITIFQASA